MQPNSTVSTDITTNTYLPPHLRLLRVTISSTMGGATSLPQIDCLGGLNKHAFNRVPPTLAQRVYARPFDNCFRRLAYLFSYQATEVMKSLLEKPKTFWKNGECVIVIQLLSILRWKSIAGRQINKAIKRQSHKQHRQKWWPQRW